MTISSGVAPPISKHIKSSLIKPFKKLYDTLPICKKRKERAKEEERELEKLHEIWYLRHLSSEEREAAKKEFAELSLEEKRERLCPSLIIL